MKIINEKNGNFTISKEFVLKSKMSIEAFNNIARSACIKKIIDNYYKIEVLELGGEKMSIDINFKGQKLTFLEIVMISSTDSTSWSDWNIDREVEKLERQEKWLEKILVKKGKHINPNNYSQDIHYKLHTLISYEYEWGRIFSFYDGRDAYTKISIQYI